MKERIRRIALARQGLDAAAPFGRGIDGVMRAIERLGYVQIDTLSVVERAHHHVIWSRVPGYDSGMLNRLVATRRVFEYWSHAASYLPMGDYRFMLPRMRAVRSGANPYYASADPTLMPSIIDRIRHDGPMRMRQFKDGDAPRSGSWNWGPLRRAFDRLFMQGDLMVVERQGMEKLFDLAERWLPADVDSRMPEPVEMARHLLDRTLGAHGAVRRDQLSYSRPGKTVVAALESEIARRLADGEMVEVSCGDGPSYFVSPDMLDLRARGDLRSVRILSPFDNCVIHRDRLSQLFDLDYRLECYVPESKRQFGYFCLPLLYRSGFAGLIDCKADRIVGRLSVVSLHLTPGLDNDAPFARALSHALQGFARLNGCQEIATSPGVRDRYRWIDQAAAAAFDANQSGTEPG